MNVPIVIAAFGTTSRARMVYQQVDAHLKVRFADHDIHWAFTSRIVRHRLKDHAAVTSSPEKVMIKLAEKGFPWVVVQSFNMICGHEFYRLVDDVKSTDCRVSIGHSLLCSQNDHHQVAVSLSPLMKKDLREAVVLVGHGTDHCAWTTYPAFYQRAEKMYGNRVYGGMIEDGNTHRDEVISRITSAGFKRVRLVPFMLVAGVHFKEDLAGENDSWKSACQAKGLSVALETQGLGALPAVMDIFCDHIQSAISVIPDTVSNNYYTYDNGNGRQAQDEVNYSPYSY